jgi:hypothetical protein
MLYVKSVRPSKLVTTATGAKEGFYLIHEWSSDPRSPSQLIYDTAQSPNGDIRNQSRSQRLLDLGCSSVFALWIKGVIVKSLS